MTARLVHLVGLLLLAGCGAAGDSPDGGPTSGRPSTVPSSSFTEDLTATPSAGRGRVITVRGPVSEGVEAGCLVLTTAEGSWSLVGQTSRVRTGDTVTVRGAVMEDLATTCQQGTPLWVDEVLER